MTKLNASRWNAFLCNRYALPPPYSIRVALNYRYFANKKVKKTCQRQMRKLNSRSNQSSTFAIFGGSKMSLQKLSERQHDFKSFPKTRQDFTKKSQKFKVSKFSRELALTCRWNNAKRFTDLHWVSSFCEFCITRIEYGGVRAARNAVHSTSSAHSEGGRPQKKSMGQSKKSSLTEKHFRVTIGSLTSR